MGQNDTNERRAVDGDDVADLLIRGASPIDGRGGTEPRGDEDLAVARRLAAGLAHEISNPLAFATANVRSAIETLETAHGREPSLAPLLDDVLAALRDAATGNERVARVVSELRDFAEPDAGRRGPVRVPSAPPEAGQISGPHDGPKPTAHDGPKPTVGRARVLVIDDEPMLLNAVRRMLAGPHDVETADGGEPGLELILAAEPPFDAVICDVNMPGMSGLELHERLSAIRPELVPTVIFVSGGAANAKGAAFLDTVQWLGKPFSRAQIEQAISGVLARRDIG